MENENLICGVCSVPYDTNRHLPRILINCGHTLCSDCLIKILGNSTLRKCPFDNNAFKKAQNNLDHFPKNFALLALIERKAQATCQAHGEKLILFCFQDKRKICGGCAISGEHKGHYMKEIRELKAQGTNLKRILGESLAKFEKFEKEKDQDASLLKEEFLKKVRSKFEEMKDLIKAKELEWTREVEDLFLTTENELSLLKKDTSKAIREIDQACETEENFAVLDQDFSSIFSRLEPPMTKEGASKFPGELSRMTQCVESFLADQAKAFKEFTFSKEKVKPEPSLSSEKLIEAKPEPVFFQNLSLFTFGVSTEGFYIKVKNPNSIDSTVNFGSQKKLKRVSIELERYDSLFQNPGDLNFLSEILHQLNSFTSLTIKFAPEGLNDSIALYLLSLLLERIQHLVELEISFERCEITDEPILFFCNEYLSKATSLRSLVLKLSSTPIYDESFFVLATKILSLKYLENFRLNGSNTKITLAGVSAIFKGIPPNIRGLEMDFKNVHLHDEVIDLFEHKVLPKLRLVEDVYLRLEGRDSKDKIFLKRKGVNS